MAEPKQPHPLTPEELGFETIVYEKAGPRATVTLNRPDVLNAFDFQMLRELARAFEDSSWDDEIRVVVVTGTGRAFCVGADLRTWGEDLLGNSRAYWKWFGAFKDMHDRLREIGKPTIARCQGIAVGGGNELQMGCDLTVMVEDAFIRHVGLEHGSVPAGGATQWLPIMVGDRRAREIILLCEEIPAPQAAEWGLINRAVPAAELDASRRRLGREARAQAARDDALREAAAQLVARRLLARDRRPRARLALDVDARRGGPGRGPRLPRPPRKVVELRTERLVLRPVTEDDLDVMLAIRNAPEVVATTSTRRAASPRADGRPAAAPGRVLARRAGSARG